MKHHARTYACERSEHRRVRAKRAPSRASEASTVAYKPGTYADPVPSSPDVDVDVDVHVHVHVHVDDVDVDVDVDV